MTARTVKSPESVGLILRAMVGGRVEIDSAESMWVARGFVVVGSGSARVGPGLVLPAVNGACRGEGSPRQRLRIAIERLRRRERTMLMTLMQVKDSSLSGEGSRYSAVRW